MDRLRDSAETVRAAFAGASPRCALILGSGWGAVADAFDRKAQIPYGKIECLGATGIEGHAGRIILARHGQMDVLIFQGRRHWYEGAGWDPIAFPVFAARQLGADVMVLTNAAGGIREDLKPGTLMRIDDHINAMGVHPLIGPHDSQWGVRFPDQTRLYDPELGDVLQAADAGAGLSRGVYAATSGPTYETPAEVRALRALGADAVGMSTVPEAMLAHAAGLRVVAVSCISNHAAGVSRQPITHQEVMDETARAMPAMQRLLGSFLDRVTALPSRQVTM